MTTDTAVTALLARVAALEAKVERLEARYGPRDAAEAAVLPAIVESVGGAKFVSRELLTHARLTRGALAAALLAADVTTTREVGKLLTRLEGQMTDGFWLARVGEDRRGIVWQVQFSRV